MNYETVVLKCQSCKDGNCGEPCIIISERNKNREARTPAYCIMDGRGARWKSSKSKVLRKKLSKAIVEDK